MIMNLILDKLPITIHAIKNELLNNEEIKKLLMHSTPNALSLSDVTRDTAKNSVLTTPFVNQEDEKLKLHMNTFIAIYTTRIFSIEDQDMTYITTSIYTNANLFELDNNDFRLYKIGSEIEKTLQHKKFNIAGQLVLEEMEFVSLDNSKKLGLVMNWAIIDG